MKAENRGNEGFLQRASVEHQEMQKRGAQAAAKGKNETVQATCWKRYWTGIT